MRILERKIYFFLFISQGVGNLSVFVQDINTKRKSLIWLSRGSLGNIKSELTMKSRIKK